MFYLEPVSMRICVKIGAKLLTAVPKTKLEATVKQDHEKPVIWITIEILIALGTVN
jgi:hypothetical protein